MIFEDLLKKALDDDSPEPLQDLLHKAIDWTGVKPTGKKKVFGPAKLPTPQGSPASADVKTNTQLNSETIPVQQQIITPNGPQTKTFHQKIKTPKTKTSVTPNQPAGPEQATLMIPAEKTAGNKTKKQKDISHQTHPKGGTVVTGHEEGQIPVDVQLDHKSKWYHDNVQLGDHVYFNGANPQYPGWNHVGNSEVIAVNPGGKKVLHVKPIADEHKANPEQFPNLEVHYADIDHFQRPKKDNPHQFDHFQYNGEYEEPAAGAPENSALSTPSKVLSPEEHHAHQQHLQEIWKNRVDKLQGHLDGGDIIEFKAINPTTGKMEIMHGTAHNLTAQVSNAKKKQAQAKGEEAPDLKTIIVQTKDGFEEVPLEQINRFGKYLVDELHMFKFNPEKLKWERDGKSGQEVQSPADAKPEESANPVPHTMPHPDGPANALPTTTAATTQATTQTPAAEQQAAPASQPKDKSDIITQAGGKFVAEDHEDNTTIFQDPNTGALHTMATDEVTPESVANLLGTKKAEMPTHPTPDYMADEKPPMESHWSHILPEDLVGHMRGLLDKVDKVRTKQELPASILAARHDLLTEYNPTKAAKNAAKLEKFLQNPDAVPPVKAPLSAAHFSEKLGTPDLTNVSWDDAVKNFGSNRPASNFLQTKQAGALANIQKYLTEHGITGVDVKKFDPAKDSRTLMQFVRHQVKQAAEKQGKEVPPLAIHIPSDEEIQNSDHLQHLSAFMNKEKMNLPAMDNKVKRLNFLLEHNPDTSEVQHLFNDLHSYLYDTGHNHPAYTAMVLKASLDEVDPKKFTPEQLNAYEGLGEVLTRAANGEMPIPWEKTQQLVHQVAKNHHIPLPPVEPIPYDRSAWAKQGLDSIIQHRQFLKDVDKLKQSEADDKKAEQVANEAPQAKLPQDSNANIHHGELAAKHIHEKIEFVNNHLKNYMLLLDAVQKNGHMTNEDKVHATHMYSTLKEAIGQLPGRYQEANEKYGVADPKLEAAIGKFKDFDKLVPKPPGIAEEKSNDNDAQMQEWIGKKYDEHMQHRMDSVKNHAVLTHNAIQTIRRGFLSRLNSHLPDVKDDIKTIDEQVGQMLNNQQYKPIDPNGAATPQGTEFIYRLNEKILQLQKIAKINEVDLQDVLGKSLHDVVAAEKVLARRDISLALRKSFYNDKQSGYVKHATELLGAYVDDFIDAVMYTYKNIPADVKKGMCRKLLKSLLIEVVRDNEFSARMMKDDFTAPLNDNIVKSMGQRIAGLVTEFRMEGTEQPFLVVEMNKSLSSVPREPIRVTSLHKSFASGTQWPAEMWVGLLTDIEDKMYKAGCFDYQTCENRIKKFVADNDQRNLLEFYNQNVKLLDARLAELK